MYNNGNSSKNVTGASVVDGTLENADFADNTISGDKIDGGTISGSVTLVTPDIGTPSAGVLTSCSGTASNLTAGTVTTNANLTGVVTSSGNATAIADNAISGDKIDAGVISNFQSTGIDDRQATGKSIYTKGTKTGIGESTPAAMLHVSQTYATPTGGISADTTGIFSKSNTGNGNCNVSIASRSSGEARLYFGDETDENKWQIVSKASNQGMSFGYQGTEAMRIDSSGNVLVGYTSSFDNVSYLPLQAKGMSTKIGGTGGASQVSFFNDNGRVGYIGTSGTTTTYYTSSDYRLKENVVPMTGSIDRLKTLKPSRFNFIADADTTVDGFLAHEAQEVVPEAVGGIKDAMRDEPILDDEGNETGTQQVPDYQGIDQSKLVPLLVSALQEAIARIETLENA